jgi:hypothetical protein
MRRKEEDNISVDCKEVNCGIVSAVLCQDSKRVHFE